MRIALRIPKATNIHSQYVTLTAFPLQESLRERAWVLRYKNIGCPLYQNTNTNTNTLLESHKHKRPDVLTEMTAVSLFLITFLKVNRRFITANRIRDETRFASLQSVSSTAVAVCFFAQCSISIQRYPSVYFSAYSIWTFKWSFAFLVLFICCIKIGSFFTQILKFRLKCKKIRFFFCFQ